MASSLSASLRGRRPAIAAERVYVGQTEKRLRTRSRHHLSPALAWAERAHAGPVAAADRIAHRLSFDVAGWARARDHRTWVAANWVGNRLVTAVGQNGPGSDQQGHGANPQDPRPTQLAGPPREPQPPSHWQHRRAWTACLVPSPAQAGPVGVERETEPPRQQQRWPSRPRRSDKTETETKRSKTTPCCPTGRCSCRRPVSTSAALRRLTSAGASLPQTEPVC